MSIVEMVLAGSIINKEIVGGISAHGGRAVGPCGCGLIRATRRVHVLPDGREIDLGRVGEVKTVDPMPLELLQEYDFVPVLAPLGLGPGGELLNINADLARATWPTTAVMIVARSAAEGMLRSSRGPVP